MPLAATDADHMVVERFVDGREVGIDALVQNGRLLLMLPHEKYVYHSGHTGIPIGHFCPMEVSPRLHENMLHETEKIIRATGMDNCAINIDAMILPDESVSIIESRRALRRDRYPRGHQRLHRARLLLLHH